MRPLLVLLLWLHAVTAELAQAGDSLTVPGWCLHSSAGLESDVATLSQPGANTSDWYRVSYRGSVFAGLLENGVYNETELFFSDDLETMVDYSDFKVPWLYREELSLTPSNGQRYYLVTNGITSRADIYLNGHQVADNLTQVGAYGGKKYDITQYLTSGANCVLIRAYPTNYIRDFAMGFVDWNPYPPDNGTGIWREISLHQSGPVSISAPRIKTDFAHEWQRTVTVVVRLDLQNSINESVNADVSAVIQSENGTDYQSAQTVLLQAGEEKTVSLVVTIDQPRIWWPALWGDQPLYNINATVSTNGTLSDIAESRSFGIRHVSSYVNGFNDTAFLVNGHPFLVQGAGYSADIFYRFDTDRARRQLQLVRDMGLNTIRLEGKQEHPELYQLADEMGLMIMAGWECCDKWEKWPYNEDVTEGELWDDADYATAQASMLHEVAMMQTHPSLLAFLVGSDYWPDDRATQIYVEALDRYDWPNPIIASAAKRGYPELVGPSGMKMDGPYDWVPPIYWWGDELGAAFGFGSELGAGVGTPEIGSLHRFLSADDLDDLWQAPDKGLYHMSTNVSSFYDRSIYNEGLFQRYGEPTSLEDYLIKAQIMDYEATRAQFEGFAARKTDMRPATGLIYWMLNGAWPNLHWQLFDYYLAAAGSYYGMKVGSRAEHVIYNYDERSIYVVSHALNSSGTRNVTVDLVDLNGTSLGHQEAGLEAFPNSAQYLDDVEGIDNITDVAFLRVLLKNGQGTQLSRNVYWLTAQNDVLNWTNSSWYSTPVTDFADMTALFEMQNATLNIEASQANQQGNISTAQVRIENQGSVPAFFVRLILLDGEGNEVLPAFWSDNYVTLLANETLSLEVDWEGDMTGKTVLVSGGNVAKQNVTLN